jgi:hypothetical protein
MGARKTFKCKFNDRVTSDNRDGVIQSLINQFEGLDSDPEVTLDGDTFSITLTISDNLPPTLVRDKLALNYFIDRVSTGESIRKIQIMRLPKANQEVLGDGKGQLDGIASDTGVDEVLFQDGAPIKRPEYKIDMGDRPDGPPVKHRTNAVFTSSWVKQGNLQICDFCGEPHQFELKTSARKWTPENATDRGLPRPFNPTDPEVANAVGLHQRTPVPFDSYIEENHPNANRGSFVVLPEGTNFVRNQPQADPEREADCLINNLCPHCGEGFEPGEKAAIANISLSIGQALPRHIRCLREVAKVCPFQRGLNTPESTHWDHFTQDEENPTYDREEGLTKRFFEIGTHEELRDKAIKLYTKYSGENFSDEGIKRGEERRKNFPYLYESSPRTKKFLREFINKQNNKTITSSWVKQADPGSLRNEGQAFTREPDSVIGPEDLTSDATDVTKLPNVFATENDAGGSQFGQPFDKKTVMDSVDRAPLETRGPRVTVFNSGTTPARATGGPIPFNSWLSETEATEPKREDTKGPLDFTASLKGEKTDSENIDSAIELPEATQGGTVLGLEGWFSASLHFSYDDNDSDDDGTYDYSEEYGDDDGDDN